MGSTKSLLSGVFDKENHTLSSLGGLSAIPDIPVTPIRTRSVLRSAVSPGSFRPPKGMVPSPASSEELSPVGKTIMEDVRRQRGKIREVREREREREREVRKDSGRRGYQKSG